MLKKKIKKVGAPKSPTYWGTADEMNALNFMASKESRGKYLSQITIQGRIDRIEGWLATFNKRVWKCPVDLNKCFDHAHKLLEELK